MALFSIVKSLSKYCIGVPLAQVCPNNKPLKSAKMCQNVGGITLIFGKKTTKIIYIDGQSNFDKALCSELTFFKRICLSQLMCRAGTNKVRSHHS